MNGMPVLPRLLGTPKRPGPAVPGQGHTGRGDAVRHADKKLRPALNFARDLTGVRQLDAHGGRGLMGRE